MEHTIKTTKQDEMIDITHIIQDDVTNSSIENGVVIVFVLHTTAGITINENADPDVVYDILNTLRKVFPKDLSHRHLEGNSHAHIKASVMGSSCTIIIEKGKLKFSWRNNSLGIQGRSPHGKFQRLFFFQSDKQLIQVRFLYVPEYYYAMQFLT